MKTKQGGKRPGAGRKKKAPTTTKCFRISLELHNKLEEIKGLNKLVTEFLESKITDMKFQLLVQSQKNTKYAKTYEVVFFTTRIFDGEIQRCNIVTSMPVSKLFAENLFLRFNENKLSNIDIEFIEWSLYRPLFGKSTNILEMNTFQEKNDKISKNYAEN